MGIGWYWEEYKGLWGERFSYLENYSRLNNSKLAKWSSSDVENFISQDPLHGPTVTVRRGRIRRRPTQLMLKAARDAAKFAVVGSAIGAVSTAAFAWKYSRSPHGAALSFAAGAVFGMTFGQEIGSHCLQLYRLDTMTAQVKFLEWWEKKSLGKY